MKPASISGSVIESRILVIRGHRVMLSGDLAKLYGVQVKAINQAVKRNADRFPDALESKYDRQFKVVFDAIRELMTPPVPAPKRRIGFVSGD